jgi:23S rRNA (pseudouridine1915-N3)-methyltransferase
MYPIVYQIDWSPVNIRILCVGTLKEKYWKDAISEYRKRLSAYCNLSIEEVKESSAEDVNEEGDRILKKIKPEEVVIALEIQGAAKSSQELSSELDALALSGKSNLVFVIGGSMGLSPAVSSRADRSLSFSRMTFPHQMMRVILLEQIYRSFKISRNEKYHK